VAVARRRSTGRARGGGKVCEAEEKVGQVSDGHSGLGPSKAGSLFVGRIPESKFLSLSYLLRGFGPCTPRARWVTCYDIYISSPCFSNDSTFTLLVDHLFFCKIKSN
jgi:hypothetical protein